MRHFPAHGSILRCIDIHYINVEGNAPYQNKRREPPIESLLHAAILGIWFRLNGFLYFCDMAKAIFPGSFDPVTLGHMDIIERGATLFSKLYVAIGMNSSKKNLYSLDERLTLLRNATRHLSNVEVLSFKGLTVSFAREMEASYIVRGLRNTTDFEFEKNIAFMNGQLATDVETVFFMCRPEHAAIHSSIVREVILSGGDASLFLPPSSRA